MSDAEYLRKHLLEARTKAVDLGDGRKVIFLRPRQEDLARISGRGLLDIVCDFVCDWDGWTDAHVIGAALGSNSKAEFSSALWNEIARDNIELAQKIYDEIIKEISRYAELKLDAKKN